MFVRKKKNRSGSISIVVVDKSRGRFREVRQFGVAHTEAEADALYTQAREWICRYAGQQTIDFGGGAVASENEVDMLVSRIDGVSINGAQLLLNRIYDSVGFNRIKDDVLRHLVVARISQPSSKLATTSYLRSYFKEDIDLSRIYRYMDKLYNSQMELVQEISITHTRSILGGSIGLLFYDVTTLYFEAAPKDDMRQSGFSKDGKTAEAQIVLGLLVSRDGYPLSYSIFNGSQYEGYTMIPIIDDFVSRFSLADFVIVADSGLMSAKNIRLLRSAGYKYIVGARIKTENSSLREWILSLEKTNGAAYETRKDDGDRLIVSYSANRASNDARNRAKGVARLEKSYRTGKLTKDKINKRGYNKFLEISKDVEVTISQERIAEDERWDGLKGYVTNTDLRREDVIDQYHGLWVVEKAFRVSKGNLEMRPIFHFTERRIEAHICICFVAYKVYKELERVIRHAGIAMSVDKVLDIAKTIITIDVRTDGVHGVSKRTLFLTEEQKAIKQLFEMDTSRKPSSNCSKWIPQKVIRVTHRRSQVKTLRN